MWEEEEEKKGFLHRQFFSCSISIPTPLPGRPLSLLAFFRQENLGFPEAQEGNELWSKDGNGG